MTRRVSTHAITGLDLRMSSANPNDLVSIVPIGKSSAEASL